MHVISRKPFNDAAKIYPNDRIAIETTYKLLRNGIFNNPNELRQLAINNPPIQIPCG